MSNIMQKDLINLIRDLEIRKNDLQVQTDSINDLTEVLKAIESDSSIRYEIAIPRLNKTEILSIPVDENLKNIIRIRIGLLKQRVKEINNETKKDIGLFLTKIRENS